MRTIKFDNQDSYDDYNLLTKRIVVGTPKPKTSKISVEGRDGQIDTSEAVAGRITYENRSLTFEFRAVGDDSSDRVGAFVNAVHGKVVEVQIDDYDEGYFRGRCSLTIDEDKGYYIDLSCEVDAQPYLWSSEESSQTLTVGPNTVTVNSAAPVTPTFHATQATTVTYDGAVYNLQAGDHVLGSIVIIDQAIITVDEQIRITWVEGRL